MNDRRQSPAVPPDVASSTQRRRWFGLLGLAGLASALWLGVPAGLAADAPHTAKQPSVAWTPPQEAPLGAPVTPSAPKGQERLRLAVLSDLNGSYGSVTYGPDVHAATRALIGSLRPDLVLITGDMVAGQRRGLDYGAMWRGFHQAVTEPLGRAGISIAPTPGNHDASPAAPFTVERQEYARQWKAADRVPQVQFLDNSQYPFHYSFEYGGVFFASIDAAAVGPIGDNQRRWLERQLSATQAAVKIVFGHLPVYPFAAKREREVLADDALAEVLNRQAVTAYISGHHHAYYPGVVDGVRHIAMPCLGGGPRRLLGQARRSPSALVVLEIEGEEVTILEALRAPEFTSPIVRGELPNQVAFGSERILRDDHAGLAPLWVDQTSQVAFWEQPSVTRPVTASRSGSQVDPSSR